MSPVRPLERADAARVAGLYERVSRSGSRTPAPGLAAYLERVLLDQPWRDPEIPSVVYEVDGRITAFLGIHVRRLRFDGQPIRLAAFGQLVSDPDVRGRPGGVLLLRHALAGEQDVSMAYFPTHLARMWESLGGRTSYLTSIGWLRVLRPAGLLAELALRRVQQPALEPLVRPVRGWAPRGARLRSLLDALAFGAGRDASTVRVGSVEPLTPELIVEHLPSLAAGVRIRPDYDTRSLTWLLDEMRAVTTRGELAGRLVRDDGRAVVGWYLAYFDPQRICRVMQLVARPGDAGAVLDQLMTDAESRASVAVAGRLEPQLAGAVWERPMHLRRIGRDVLHARDPALLGALMESDALITALEGETWMGHQSAPVPGPPDRAASPRSETRAAGAARV
jgi:hypothetical protein